jgi:hypothetical protein
MPRRRLPLLVLGAAAVLAAGAVVAASCGGGGQDEPAAESVASKPEAAPPVAPLTGLPDRSGASRKRCAVTVKIDNTPASRPKWGIDQADVVYEEVVEGGITRLAAVFNSKTPDRVASVRSVRKTDQSLVTPLRGVFAYSGGAQYAIDSINSAPVVQLDESRAGDMMFRDERNAPYDLNARVDQMYATCEDPAPPPLFSYRKKGAPVPGDRITAAHVGFLAGFDVTWTWDPTTHDWKRSIFGEPELAASGEQFAPKNVVVMFTRYVGGNSQGVGAEAELVGEGRLMALTGGKVVNGTWKRPDRAKAAQLLDATGATVKLAPGPTWVELPDAAYDVTVTPEP